MEHARVNTDHFTQVPRLGVAHGDGGVLPLEQFSDGRAHDAASAQHHGALAGDGDPRALDELQDPRRRARDEARHVSQSHAPFVHCVQAEIEGTMYLCRHGAAEILLNAMTFLTF